MRFLLTLNDPPYGTERSYNGDAVGCAIAGQKTPDELAEWTLWADKVLTL